MILRRRQKLLVERSLRALDEHGNTLAVAPTGAGKTIMLSAVVGQKVGPIDGKACVLAHRDELTAQNRAKFARVHPSITTSVVDARTKSWEGQVVFAMAPTLERPANLKPMPTLDLLVIDEAHRVGADGYRRIIDHALARNPACSIYGVTATPMRGDGKGLQSVFTNVADQIHLSELVRSGHLVIPRTLVIDVGVQGDLAGVRRTADDFDMEQVDRIMNRKPVIEAVIRHWKENAGGRQSVIFCSTKDHARNVYEAFLAASVPTVLVTGDMGAAARRAALAKYAAGDAQVIVNVAVLTEGWDHPPTSCVVLLRPSSFKSTMVQMIGRGLRPVNPEEHPGVVKTDCVILDFGCSTLVHGTLEQDVQLGGRDFAGARSGRKCPECGGTMPASITVCPLCGHTWKQQPAEEEGPLSDFVMTEIDLLNQSSFAWSDLWEDGTTLLACGFDGWAGVFFRNGRWYAVGGAGRRSPHLLAIGERPVCLAAADDWLNNVETKEAAYKSRSWLNEPATPKQLSRLPAQYQLDFDLRRYKASALITYHSRAAEIQSLMSEAEAAALRKRDRKGDTITARAEANGVQGLL